MAEQKVAGTVDFEIVDDKQFVRFVVKSAVMQKPIVANIPYHVLDAAFVARMWVHLAKHGIKLDPPEMEERRILTADSPLVRLAE